ncbi:MAG TPA: hypothetical protein VIM58_10320, partial [Candidatus Methylacidiphilales bacterium]
MPPATAFFHGRTGVPRSRPARSFALVLVLGCLVFLSALVLAFLSGVTTELQSSQFYANSAQVKILADSASSLAMGQIKDATRGVDASGGTLAWASQPGMIRTYGTDGNPAGYYKLY